MHPEIIVEQIKERFPENVLDYGTAVGQTWAVIKRENIDKTCRFLTVAPDIKMDYLIDITAIGLLPKTPRL